MSYAISAIRRSDGMDIKDIFRFIKLMFRVNDDLQIWRVEALLCPLLELMEASSRYVLATEVSIDMLLRLCKVLEPVRTWVADPSNASHMQWLEVWLDKRRFNSHVTGQVQSKSLPPVKQPLLMHLVSNRRTGSISFNGYTNAALAHAALLRLQAGELLQGDDTYDSDDDPSSLCGRRIEVKWGGGQFYAGKVEHYYEPRDELDVAKESGDKILEDQHRIFYDDGEVKPHLLSIKTWKILN
jgi:hypothetical protein